MKSIKTEIKWAFLFTIMTIGWLFLEKVVGLHDKHIEYQVIFTNFFAIPAILFYVMALKEKKKKHIEPKFTYKNAVLSGLILTFIITLLAPLGTYISVEYMSPEFFKNAIKASVEMEYYTQQEALDYFNTSNYMLQSVIGALGFGVLTTLIVAIFIRSK